jgi:nicotinamide-nucleotide amidase
MSTASSLFFYRLFLPGEIVTIGDELNRGEIVDSNAAFIAQRLADVDTARGAGLGRFVKVCHRQGVNDEPDEIAAALQLAAGRTAGGVVVVSGGLGPTSDDLTVEVAARLAGVPPVVEPAHEQRLRERFFARGVAVTPNNLRQVRVPKGAIVLPNQAGLAPGFAIELGGSTLFFLPGVPRELKPMFDAEVVPRVQAIHDRNQQQRRGAIAAGGRRVYRVIGLGESHVDHKLAGLVDAVLPAEGPQVSVHYRLAFPEVLVTIIARAAQQQQVEDALERLDAEVRRRLGSALYGAGEDELPVVLGAALRARGATLATAESCTGGLIGELMTAVPGSSDYFLGGVIAYANEVKIAALAVRPETLRQHGAVSEPTVREMARGARRLLGSTYGVAVSGVAGPGGGTPEKPVGTVHLAVAGPDDDTVLVHKILWPGERDQVRRVAALAALNLVHKALFPERLEDASLRI